LLKANLKPFELHLASLNLYQMTARVRSYIGVNIFSSNKLIIPNFPAVHHILDSFYMYMRLYDRVLPMLTVHNNDSW